jgi:hypothetical protein
VGVHGLELEVLRRPHADAQAKAGQGRQDRQLQESIGYARHVKVPGFAGRLFAAGGSQPSLSEWDNDRTR